VAAASGWRLALLAALIAAGVALEALGVVDWRLALEWARDRAVGWQLAAAIVAAQFVLYTFAQPGSALFWVAALVYPPGAATLILTAGGTSGALGAYLLARRLARLDPERLHRRRLYRMLARQGDFFTLCALRVLPGMPHSVINYASGMLALPLARFLPATALGLAAKSWLYASALYGLAGAESPAALMRAQVLVPLVLIALLLFAGRFAIDLRQRAPAALGHAEGVEPTGEANAMQLPVQVTYRGMDSSAALDTAVREKAAKLEQFHPRIMSCRVVVEETARHKTKGKPFEVRIDLKVPGGEVAVTREHDSDVYVALRDAFDAARRKLEDFVREQRGDVKHHELTQSGTVARILAEEGYGFIATADGRELYFSRENVVTPPFEHLAQGTPVHFIEELAAEGPQAKRVSARTGH
jgi:ribosomal subunit interface protein